jgi:hypothetical protein
MKKDRKKQREELLGMSTSTAEKKLRKSVILDLAKQLGKNVCLECGVIIEDPEDLAIMHVEDWEGDPNQYFDLTNIAFGHVTCGAGDHGRGQEAESKMRRVEVIVEDRNGTPLRGCVHQGQTYVAGEKDQRYQVRVRNTTSRRVLVVVTVDGRNVNTGQKGAVSDSGHVLEPYAQWTFLGWRQSDDQVAAFRLGAKDDSYSAQMGSPENVGIIGVAVFEEKRVPVKVITVREKVYVPLPYPVPTYPVYPRPSWPDGPIWVGDVPYNNYGTGLTATFSAICSTTQDSSSTVRGMSSTQSTAKIEQACHQQVLGTEYGESVSSQVVKATFKRASDHPSEIISIRYDSLDVLVEAGIMGRTPSQARQQAPQAFPASPGYCSPPPHVRAYKE